MAETHLSTVVLVGDRAYKVLKPVAFDFVDLSTLEARWAACEREVALNSRIAPDVYRGVATYRGPNSERAEPVIVMERMPAERSLERLAREGADVGECVHDIARTLAAFHAGADRSPGVVAHGRPEAVRAAWVGNVTELKHLLGSLDSEMLITLDETDALGRRYLAGREALLERRIADGAVCDGHGDLLAADIYCLESGPEILDCLAFRDDFRAADVVCDVAFLTMDLERLGRPDLAHRLLDDYREFSGDTSPASLTEYYVSFRALIRSKVAVLRALAGDESAAREGHDLLNAAREHARRATVRLVLVGGLPGTGKSTLAAGLADDTGFVLLRSDVVRRELARELSPRYDDASKDAVYDEILDRASTLLAHGENVIVDASWTAERYRRQAETVGMNAKADVLAIRTDLDQEEAAERIGARMATGADESQATPQIAARLAHDADPWPEAHVLDTSGSRDDTRRSARTIIGSVPDV
ncbi:MAG: AAA family ATPase [Acidimicrobiia bacterium]|nr:AAA family ATPase [Acidimicrobiia bacterium]